MEERKIHGKQLKFLQAAENKLSQEVRSSAPPPHLYSGVYPNREYLSGRYDKRSSTELHPAAVPKPLPNESSYI